MKLFKIIGWWKTEVESNRVYTRKNYLTSVLLAVFIGAFTSWYVGYFVGKKEVQDEAVSLGFGSYAKNDVGFIKFKWKYFLLPAE